jgi:hypothetical protein
MCSQWYHRVVAFQKSDSSSEAFEFDSSESERRAQIKIEEAFEFDSSESERRAQIEIEVGYNNKKKKLWIQIRKNRNTLLRCTLKIR